MFKFSESEIIKTPPNHAQTKNLVDYWHVLVRQKKYLLFTILLLLLVGMPIIYNLTPIYQSTAKMVVDAGQAKLVGLQTENTTGAAIDFKVNTEVEIIKSNKVYLRTIKHLQLWNSADYNLLSFGEKLLSLFATDKSQKPRDEYRTFSQLSGQDIMGYLKALNDHVTVARIRRTNVITIGVISPSANRAADIANSLTRSYLAEKIENKANSMRGVAEILKNQLNKLAIEIQNFDRQRENFITEYADQISDPNAGKILAELRATIDLKTQETLRKILEVSEIGRAALAKDYFALASLTEDLQFGALFSQYESINFQLSAPRPADDSQFNLQQELQKIEANFELLSQQMQNKLNAEIFANQAQIAEFQTNRIHIFSAYDLPQDVQMALYRLTEGIKSKRNLYASEVKKYSEVEQKIGILIPDVRVIATAFPPEAAIKPNKKLLAAGLLIFAVFCGLILAFMRDEFIGGFVSSDQVHAVLGKQPISVIPTHTNEDDDNIILNAPLSRFSESIRMLRVGLDNHSLNNNVFDQRAKIIAVTSTVPEEGKTTTALCLARSYSLAGKKTILVELDFRHPVLNERLALNERLGLNRPYSLQDFIKQDADMAMIDKIIYVEPATNLSIVLAGAAQKTATDILIQSKSLEGVISKFSKDFEIIIIDTPPVGLVVDGQIIAQKVDQMVYAIKHAATSQKNVLAGINFINAATVDLPVFTIITQLDDSQAGYFGMYGVEYSYYYGG